MSASSRKPSRERWCSRCSNAGGTTASKIHSKLTGTTSFAASAKRTTFRSDVGVEPEAVARTMVLPLLQRWGHDRLEDPLEADRDDVVRREREADDLQI